MPPLQLRPRSTTEIIDAAVSLLRQHYVELVTATALFTVPLFIANELIAPQMGIQPGIHDGTIRDDSVHGRASRRRCSRRACCRGFSR